MKPKKRPHPATRIKKKIDAKEKVTKRQLLDCADFWFSATTRLRNYNKNTGVQCYSCERYLTIPMAQAGHIVPRNFYSVRYLEENIVPECVVCNVIERELGKMKILIKMYEEEGGKEKIKKLMRIANKNPLSDTYLVRVINDNFDEAQRLMEQKEITPWW